LNLIANSYNKFYGDPNPKLDGVFTGEGVFTGSVFRDGITNNFTLPAGLISVDNGTNAIVGQYPITPNIIDPNNKLQNYNYSLVSGVLSVLGAPLHIYAADKLSKPGAPIPTLTFATNLITGFVNGQGLSVISVWPSLTTTATSASPAGTYPIVVGNNGIAPNYSIVPHNGTLTIAPNRAPVVGAPLTFVIAPGDTLKIPADKLKAGAYDPDNDPLAIVNYQKTSLRGAQVVADSKTNWIYYLPPLGTGSNTNGFTDTFTYDLSDGTAAPVTGTVYVIMKTPDAMSIINPRNLIINVSTNVSGINGVVFLRFGGIAGRYYKIQGNANIYNPNSWYDLPVIPFDSTNPNPMGTVATNQFDVIISKSAIKAIDSGWVEYYDTDVLNQKFYRSVYAP